MENKGKKILILILSLLTCVLGFKTIIDNESLKITLSILFIVLVLNIFFIIKFLERNKINNIWFSINIIAIVSIFFNILGEAHKVSVIVPTVSIFNSIILINIFIKEIIVDYKKINITIRTFITVVITLSSLIVIAYNAIPAHVTAIAQKIVNAENKHFSELTNTKNYTKNGYILYNDIKYSNEYPNSFFDIYLVDENDVKRPTCIYVHGGGYVWGDKSRFGSLINNLDSIENIESFLDAGYNVVAINYALAPEYIYPTPILQLDQAIEFLQTNGHNYNINMDETFYLGWSAGGQIVGQYLNIQSNEEYAEKMGIQPKVDMSTVYAVIMNSALLDVERIDKTNKDFTNFLFRNFGLVYFDTKVIENNEKVIEANIINNVNEKFPPTYITDGNIGSFQDQAFELHEKLKSIGVKTEINYHDINEIKLPHFYEGGQSSKAIENREKQIKFLKEVFKSKGNK